MKIEALKPLTRHKNEHFHLTISTQHGLSWKGLSMVYIGKDAWLEMTCQHQCHQTVLLPDKHLSTLLAIILKDYFCHDNNKHCSFSKEFNGVSAYIGKKHKNSHFVKHQSKHKNINVKNLK